MSQTSKGTGAAGSSSATGDKKAGGANGTHKADFFGYEAWEKCGQQFNQFQKLPDFDLDALMLNHRKNMETIRQAQQTASELLQGLVNLNSTYVRSSFDDLGAHVRAFSDGLKLQDVASRSSASAAAVKTSLDRSIAHCKQVTDLFSQSTSKVFECYRKRFEESLADAQQSFMAAASA